ncbi:hypothetical protein EWM62_16865 [Mucilaginibacter terrigena]|uniref:Uncharacterized protein n=1 Tax=Mucilaginibacter terrigena TaxID=2492395 RepID=A0A4Q5LI43_9SPHI|nr:hypothetical protein [Mucilaginibacter terrigena]RYU87378.1 hypothetical protein EWM62_16865 [Mucilaginibacter terrigena]
MEFALKQIYKDHPEYLIPEKWEQFNDWSRRGYDFLDSRIFYFKDAPEEMYYISFIKDPEDPAAAKSVILAVRAVQRDSSTSWLLQKDFNEKQQEEIEARFDKEIVSKLEKYTLTKAKRSD